MFSMSDYSFLIDAPPQSKITFQASLNLQTETTSFEPGKIIPRFWIARGHDLEQGIRLFNVQDYVKSYNLIEDMIE